MPEGDEVQRKIDRRQKHEHHRDHVDQRAVEITHAGVVGREAADRDGRKGVADRIEHAHAGQPVGQAAGNGQAQIDVPQRLGRLGDARRQLAVLHRAGRLGPVQLHATDAEHRQYRDRQHDDAHAAEPLQLLTVVEDRHRQSRPDCVMTVAPVVVSPDTDSNTASVSDRCGSSASTNGSAPIADSTVQNITTTTKPSRRRSSRRIPAHRQPADRCRRPGSARTRLRRPRPGAVLRRAGTATNGGSRVRLKTVSSRPRMRCTAANDMMAIRGR